MTPIKPLITFMVCKSIWGIFGYKPHPTDQYGINIESLSQCVVETTNAFFTDNTDVIVFPSSDAEKSTSPTADVLKLLGNNIRRAITVASLDKLPYSFKNCHHKCNYIIEVINQKGLKSIIDILSSFPIGNSRAEFLIISLHIFENPHTAAIELSEQLWKKNVIRVMMLMISTRNYSLYEMYSWNPFQKPNYSDKMHNISPKDYCLFGKFFNKASWFGETFTVCRNNCTFKVHYIDWPPLVLNANMGLQPSNYVLSQGFDINLLNMIANKLNLTVFYNTTSTLWGNVNEHGTAQGSFDFLLNNTADILIGGYTETTDRIKYFDVTDSHIQQFQVWCVPNVPVITGFRSMGNIFRLEVWIAIISVYLLVTACIYVSSIYNKDEYRAYRSIDNTLLTNLAVFLGAAGNALPRGTSTRYFMAMLIIFGFYVTLYYSAYLVSIISAPKYVQKYNTLKDIYDYQLKTYFMPDDIKWILNDSSITSTVSSEIIRNRWINCSSMTWCFEKVATSEATSFYTNNLYKNYFLASHNHSMHCIQYNKIGTPVALILRKGFPFYKQFNIIINRIIEAGIVAKWEIDIFKTNTSIHNKENSDTRIEFGELIPIFKFLFVSNAVSFVVFVIEIMVYRSHLCF